MIDRVVGEALGGEGIRSGGAMLLADLADGGRSYPPFTALVRDDQGIYWPVWSALATPIGCEVSSGTCTLYLELRPVGGWRIRALLTATVPPTDALAIGSGTVANNAFTAFSGAGFAGQLQPPIGSDPVNYYDESTVVGWSSPTSREIYFVKAGRRVDVLFRIYGPADTDPVNGTKATFTLPYATMVKVHWPLAVVIDNGVSTFAPGLIEMTGAQVTLRKTTSSTNWTWTNAAMKGAYSGFSYFTP